jgi:hypothetical protein
MKTVLTGSSGRQGVRITNMERLAPGFAEPSVDVGAAFPTVPADFTDKITLVLALDHRAFMDWRNRQQGPRSRFRYVSRGLRICTGIARAVSRLSN